MNFLHEIRQLQNKTIIINRSLSFSDYGLVTRQATSHKHKYTHTYVRTSIITSLINTSCYNYLNSYYKQLSKREHNVRPISHTSISSTHARTHARMNTHQLAHPEMNIHALYKRKWLIANSYDKLYRSR